MVSAILLLNVIDVLKGRSTISTNALEGMKVVEMIERIDGGDKEIDSDRWRLLKKEYR